jgi:hypothetical protein
MIAASKRLGEAVAEGGFSSMYVADLIVDGQVKLKDVPIPGELVSDGGAKILTQGTVLFSYSDEIGQSVIPEDITSWLAPFASFLDISYKVTLENVFTEKVLRGRLKIVGVSDPQDRRIRFQDRILTVGSTVRLKLADLFYVTDRERFVTPGGPQPGATAWGEIGLLTGLPLDKRDVADKAITRAVTYEENRLDALGDLASILDGTPYITPAGAVAIALSAWGEPVVSLGMGGTGTIVRADPDDLSDAGVYNQVVVRSWDDQQATVLATAQVESGPLRYGGPMGRIPIFASSQHVTNEAQAHAYANDLLPQVSTLPAVTYTIQCAADPRLEVFDVIDFTKDDAPYTGRIQKITLPGTGDMTLVVSVARG